MPREFGRPVLNTETIRKMDRAELETELETMCVPLDDTESDDQLRELLVSSVELDEARET
jgi:hypothetical protein